MAKLGSYLKSCLLCGEGICENDKESKISKLEGIVGGVGCKLLERQLEKMFILLKILEVPFKLCEEILQRGEGDGGDNNPDKWFILCDECVEGKVTRAWHTYQKMLTWQTRMLSVRLQIREGMRRSILKSNHNQLKSQMDEGVSQVDCEIKRYLFPELFTKVEQLEEGDFNFDNNDKEDNAYRNSLSVESTNKKYIGRRRGRPRRKSEQKTAKPSIKLESFSENDPLNLNEVNFDMDEDGPVSNDDNDDRDQDQDYQPEMEGPQTAEDPIENNSSDSDYQPEVPPKPAKSRRGRPPGTKRIHRPPDTYLFRGSLKTKRFHWSICSICDARYPSTEEYSLHMALHSQRDPVLKGPLDCPHCPFPARDPQELAYHLRRRHLQKPKTLKQTYSCPKCPFTALRWKYFKEHADLEHPTVPLSEFGSDLSLKCPECDQQQMNIASYQKHLRMQHPKDKGPVKCPSCDIKFLSGSLLAYHVNSVHKGHLRYICDECGKGFEFSTHLKRHKEGHLKKRGDLRKREHVCELCGMDFYERDTYNKHVRKQHGGIEQQGAPLVAEIFQCKYCEVKSGLKAFIKRHVMEEHRGEMAWKCDKCERRYTNAQGLKRHERLNHGGEEVPCRFCGKKFKGEEYMKDHVKKFCKLKGVERDGGEGGGRGLGGEQDEQKYLPVESGIF